MSRNISTRFSRKVAIVSFILSIGVMYIHAKNLAYYDFGDVHGTLIYVLNQIFSETLGRVAVPFFFLQSGYWLFRYDIFEKDSDILKRKLKKKVKSLVTPYLLWNTLGLLYYVIVSRISSRLLRINDGQVVHITWNNIFKGIFFHEFYLSSWFMQDLIVLTALSPVFVLLLRKQYVTYVTIVILFILSILGMNTPVCQTSSLLLFIMGGTLSVYHREYWEKPNRNYWETIIYVFIFLVGAAIRWLSVPYLSTFFVAVSPILFWKCCDFLGTINVFEHEPFWFCKQSFFIYCAHMIPVQAMSSILSRINKTMAWSCFSYIITPPVVLALLYVAARILSKRLPIVYRLLCGNRT